MADKENIIIKDTLDGLGTDAYSDYLAHALCLAGSCRLKYNGEERELQAGDLMIVRKGKLVERIRPADDFRVKVIYVTSEFIVLSTPLSNYGMKGQLALFLNPIMKLDAGQQELCRRDFEMVEARLGRTGHHFRKDLLAGSDKTVSEIAYEVGFQYPHHLSRMFKKVTGYTPKEYRGMNA